MTESEEMEVLVMIAPRRTSRTDVGPETQEVSRARGHLPHEPFRFFPSAPSEPARPLKSMRLLILTNHFLPESFRVNDIAFDRAARGDRVKVLTAIPDYPEGRFHPGYSLFRRRCERVRSMCQKV